MQTHQSQISGLQTTFLWLFNLNMPNKKEVASHSLVQKWLSWRHKRLLTISVLAVISKILERHIATSLSTYLHSYDLLYNLQSAFQPDHTTETALIKLTDELLFNMDNNMVTGLAFVSFRKAFNVINHWLLPKKLSIYEASNLSLKWFGSYLTRRKQYVRINGCCSTSKQLLQGVPQGSILGPIIFLLFVNDMPLSIHDSTLDVYADDTTLAKISGWENVPHLTGFKSRSHMFRWVVSTKQDVHQLSGY